MHSAMQSISSPILVSSPISSYNMYMCVLCVRVCVVGVCVCVCVNMQNVCALKSTAHHGMATSISPSSCLLLLVIFPTTSFSSSVHDVSSRSFVGIESTGVVVLHFRSLLFLLGKVEDLPCPSGSLAPGPAPGPSLELAPPPPPPPSLAVVVLLLAGKGIGSEVGLIKPEEEG